MSSEIQHGVPAERSASLATSAAFKIFSLVFAFATAAIYVVCEMKNWPLFTYHPGTDRIDPGFTPARRDEGPAMYWYGWTVTMLIGASIFGGLATLLPAAITRKIPLFLIWLVPILAIPLLVYSLMPFWTK